MPVRPPVFPSIDLTGFDVVPAVRSAGALGNRIGSTVGRRAVDLAKDATYVSVGLGILTYQRAQVRRRERARGRS